MSFEAEELAAPATPALLAQLYEDERVSPEAYKAGLTILDNAREIPWKSLLDRASLILGSSLFLLGVIFFFAYNWSGMHRFAKFGLIELALLGSIVVTARKGLEQIEGKVALFASMILIGALLAVIGQTYQTGADAYQLFLGWMVLSTIWVVVSRMAGAWFFWLLLANLSLGLYLKQEHGFRWYGVHAQVYLLCLNTVALAAWELGSLRFLWLRSHHRWVQRSLFASATAFGTFAVCSVILSHSHRTGTITIIAVACYLGLLAIGYYLYCVRTLDLFPLTNICVSLIAISAVGMGRISNNFEFFLFITIAVLAETAAAGYWLKQLKDRGLRHVEA